jgi:hypothetical protein
MRDNNDRETIVEKKIKMNVNKVDGATVDNGSDSQRAIKAMTYHLIHQLL